MKRYVIGDVHGCVEQLDALLGTIFSELDEDEDWKIIFVGDYVDRGPNAAECIRIIRGMQTQYGKDRVVALMGNHEDMLLVGEYTYAAETLRSYDGIIPEEVSMWMQNLPKYYEDDTIIVAHAGAKPGTPMEYQTDDFLMWYRYQQNQPAMLDKHLYHGHTPFLNLIEGSIDRTNVDTGCVFGGNLTAAVVNEQGKPVRFIQVSNEYFT